MLALALILMCLDIFYRKVIMKCCKDSTMRKVNRNWFEKLFYGSIYKCNHCGKKIKLKAGHYKNKS